MNLNALRFRFVAAVLAGMLALVSPMLGQTSDGSKPELGIVVGTVTAVNGGTVPDLTVVLEGADANDRRTAIANEDGYFEFHDVKAGTPYHVKISAESFSEWSSPPFAVEPNQFKILTDIRLHVQLASTTVHVTENSEEVATEQVKVEEKQRVLGIIPNFYEVYDPDPVPLTAKLKFKLWLTVASDPITALGLGFLSGVQQAGDTPDYGQGAEGYSKRFGANFADEFTDIMIGGAILPSILHQDPRYFYQGTGTNKSRMLHAISTPFICRGDNGRLQPNYSSLGGYLASGAISNAYYPASNRGPGLVLNTFAVDLSANVANAVIQEFVLRKLTPS